MCCAIPSKPLLSQVLGKKMVWKSWKSEAVPQYHRHSFRASRDLLISAPSIRVCKRNAAWFCAEKTLKRWGISPNGKRMGIFHGDAPYKLGILIAMLNCNCTQWLKLTRSPTNRPCHELGIGCDDFPLKMGDSQGLCWGNGTDPVLFHVVSMTFDIDKALWIEGFKIVSNLAERAQQHNIEIWGVGGCTCQSRRWFHRPSTVSVHRFKATTNESKLA